MRNIFVALATHIFKDVIDTTPNYDYFYKLVNDEINKFDLPKPIIFSWLKSSEQRKLAIADLKEHPAPNISNIKIPSSWKYDEPDFYYFTKLYQKWMPTAAAGKNHMYARTADSGIKRKQSQSKQKGSF